MTIKEFKKTYMPYAQAVEDKTGLNAYAILSQCALETGWGKHCPGNMMFGVKARKGTPEHQRQLLLTTEYSSSPNLQFPVIVSITKQPNGLYKYRVKDWFRKYDSPEESFQDHADLFQRVKRYARAWEVRHDAIKFFNAIQGIYATDPNYSKKLINIYNNLLLY